MFDNQMTDKILRQNRFARIGGVLFLTIFMF